MSRRPDTLLLCLALGCAGCIATDVPTLAPEQPLPTGTGVALLRVECVNGSGEPDTLTYYLRLGRCTTLVWHSEPDDRRYELLPAGEGPESDYYAALPPGRYRLYFTSGTSLWERDYMLLIEVRPGVASCGGTIRFHHDPMREPGSDRTVSLHDDCEAIDARFRATHPALAGEVETALFRKYRLAGRIWVPQAWGEDDSP